MLNTIKAFIIKQNFEPGIAGIFINPFYIARYGLLKFVRKFGHQVTGRVLDVGCGTKPYEKFFNASEYIGLEIDTTINRDLKKADFFYDGKTFPFPDSSFDSVITNQVIEHVFNPDEMLGEINRVLKPGGVFFISVPFTWDEHEQPYDYARYSYFGIKHLVEKNGFEVIDSAKSVTDFRVLAQLTNAYIYKLFHRNLIMKWVSILLLCAPINLFGTVLGMILPKNEDLYLDNILLVRKKTNV